MQDEDRLENFKLLVYPPANISNKMVNELVGKKIKTTLKGRGPAQQITHSTNTSLFSTHC